MDGALDAAPTHLLVRRRRDLRGCTDDERTLGHLGPGEQYRARGDHAQVGDLSAVEQCCVVPDQAVGADLSAADDDARTDNNAVPEFERFASVDDTIVLDDRVRPDANRTEVTAHYGTRPHTRSGSDLDVAHNIGGLADPSVSRDVWRHISQ